MRTFGSSIVKVDAQGREVMSDYVDDEAGELLRIEYFSRPPTLPVVQNVRAEPVSGGIKVTWDPADLTNVTEYIIRSVPALLESTIPATADTTSMEFAPYMPDPTVYQFVVHTSDGTTESAPSALSNGVAAG